MSVTKYVEIQRSNGYKNLKDKRPGDEVIEPRVAKFNNTHMPIETVEEYARRQNRRRYRVRNGEKQEILFFEKYGHLGIAKVHEMMCKEEL